ncbi:MAG TPA: HU family DNA-binding protein [Saprospiraceae bacterium]|nr:HU family DNA-binding protein [Saprospiraceae bacterium]
MNKSELIGHVAEASGITKAQATDAVNAVLDGISNTLQSGGEVRLLGFGNFSVNLRKARQGRNPATGATIQIPEKKQAKFKASKDLTNSLN